LISALIFVFRHASYKHNFFMTLLVHSFAFGGKRCLKRGSEKALYIQPGVILMCYIRSYIHTTESTEQADIGRYLHTSWTVGDNEKHEYQAITFYFRLRICFRSCNFGRHTVVEPFVICWGEERTSGTLVRFSGYKKEQKERDMGRGHREF
jgi:hypothetical protein